jgi:hypothetical protein
MFHMDDGPDHLSPGMPPALIGLLLLLAVVLAIVFLVAAQVVQTP